MSNVLDQLMDFLSAYQTDPLTFLVVFFLFSLAAAVVLPIPIEIGLIWNPGMFFPLKALDMGFDVTGRLRPGQPNALPVKVEKQSTPGSVKEKTFEAPTRTAARWAPTTRRITRRSAGTGSRRSAAGTPASGTMST